MIRGYQALLATAALAISSVTHADGHLTCDDKFVSLLHQSERFVGSLRPDKAGQRREFASDGSVFTVQQAEWMKTQLQRIGEDCATGHPEAASQHMAALQQLLKEHHRTS